MWCIWLYLSRGMQFICYWLNCKTSANELINSLSPADALWQHRFRSAVAHGPGKLMAPRHYLNQCWIIISDVMWHSPEGNFTVSTQVTTILHVEFENHYFNIITTSPRGQFGKWVEAPSKLTIIGSDGGLLPGRHQAIIWTDDGVL